MEKVPRGDIKIVMSDLNTKVGSDKYNLERVMGRNVIGVRNSNDNLFVEFCSNHNLVIGGTLFPHKDIHKTTWMSPDNRTRNQIVHIIISGTWRFSLTDMRSRRGAGAASDHHLITGDVRLKIAAGKRTPLNSLI